MDEQTLRYIIEAAGKAAAATAAAALINAVFQTAVSVKPTKIVLEKGVPAKIYSVGTDNGPSAVYVSTKKNKADWKSVFFYGAVFLGCKYILDYREKNIANISSK